MSVPLHIDGSMAPSGWAASWRGHPLAEGTNDGMRWIMRRNCSLAPRQVLQAYLLVCAVSLTIALMFAWSGATPVLWFAGVELTVLGLALLLYARHAADHETITLKNSTMSVEHHCGSRVDRAEFRAEWVRVEPLVGQGSLLELSGAGQKTLVGRYVRPEWRQSLAAELRQALRRHRSPVGPTTVFEPQ